MSREGAGREGEIEKRADRLVAGRRVDRTLYAFTEACCTLLEEEQAKPNPDNALIAVLCDAVRLVREHCDHAIRGI